MMDWLCCCNKTEKLENYSPKKQPLPAPIPLSPNIQIIAQPQSQPGITGPNPPENELKLIFIAREDPSQISEISNFRSRVRRQSCGLREIRVKVEEREKEGQGQGQGQWEEREREKVFVHLDLDYYKVMNSVVEDVRKAAAEWQQFDIWLNFDPEIQPLKMQILKDAFNFFLVLSPDSQTKYRIRLTLTKVEIPEIQKICQLARDNRLETTQECFKRDQGNVMGRTIYDE